MDKLCDFTFLELKASHCKITSFLQDIWKEWNHYRNVANDMTNKFSHLHHEYKAVCRENKTLKKDYEKLKDLIINCIRFIHDINYGRAISEENAKHALETLKKNLTDAVKDKENFIPASLSAEAASNVDKNSQNVGNRGKCCVDVQKSHYCEGNCLPSENNKNNDCAHPWKTVNSFLKENSKISFLPSNNSDENSVNGGNKSPVFKNSTSKPVFDSVNNEKCTSGKIEGSPSLANESSLFGYRKDLMSPLKRTSGSSNKIEEVSMSDSLTPKRCRSKGNKTFRSPATKSKKNSSKEDCSIKKMTQTVLNIDLFKLKTPEKTNILQSSSPSSSPKISIEVDEDDFIWESQKTVRPLQEGIAGPKAKIPDPIDVDESSEERKEKGAIDLDETYVPAEIVENCKLTDEKTWKHGCSSKLQSIPCRAKSPEYDSVPFIYNNEKSDSTSVVPTCANCEKYYRGAFGGDLKKCENAMKIFDLCSKHRNDKRRKVNTDETPPGYWKPYLTNTLASVSDEEDDT